MACFLGPVLNRGLTTLVVLCRKKDEPIGFRRAGPTLEGDHCVQIRLGQKWPSALTFYAAVAGIAIFATISLLVQTSSFGLGVSPDSVTYISTAQNVLMGRGFITAGPGAMPVDPQPLLVFPPLFPLIVALFGTAGADLFAITRYLNAFLLGAVLILVCFTLSDTTHRRVLWALGAAVVFLSPQLRQVFSFAWSEPLFILFTLLTFALFRSYTILPGVTPLLGAGITAAAAFLTRYIGVTLPACGVLIILCNTRLQFRRRTRDAALFALVAVLPSAAWMTRNWLISGTLTDLRPPASATVEDLLGQFASTTSGWFLPSWAFGHRVLIAILIGCLIFGAIHVCRAFIRGSATRDVATVFPFVIFIPIYSAIFITLASRTATDPLGDRYLSPIYIPLVILAVWSLDRLLPLLQMWSTSIRFDKIALVGLTLWLFLFPGRIAVHQIIYAIRQGAGGYADKGWNQDTFVASLRAHMPVGKMYTDDPFALYYLTGITAQITPRKRYYASTLSLGDTDLESLINNISQKTPVYIIWFNRDIFNYLFSLQELQDRLKTETVFQNSDGAILRVLGSRAAKV